MARNWFFDRLELVALDILTEEEKRTRREFQIVPSRMHLMPRLNEAQLGQVQHLHALLATGLKVR